MRVLSPGQEDTLEKGMATHSSIAWRFPWTEEPSGLQSKMTDYPPTHTPYRIQTPSHQPQIRQQSPQSPNLSYKPQCPPDPEHGHPSSDPNLETPGSCCNLPPQTDPLQTDPYPKFQKPTVLPPWPRSPSPVYKTAHFLLTLSWAVNSPSGSLTVLQPTIPKVGWGSVLLILRVARPEL